MTVEKIYDAAARSKLTLTKKGAVIRFERGLSGIAAERVDAFLSRVAEIAPEYEHTMRGNLARHAASDTLYILLRNESNTESAWFFESDVFDRSEK